MEGKVPELLKGLGRGQPGIGPGMAHPPRGEKCWEDVPVFSERRSEVICSCKERGVGICGGKERGTSSRSVECSRLDRHEIPKADYVMCT